MVLCINTDLNRILSEEQKVTRLFNGNETDQHTGSRIQGHLEIQSEKIMRQASPFDQIFIAGTQNCTQ